MGGLATSVGGAIGNAANAMADTLGSIVHALSAAVPGGFPVVAIVAVVVIGLVLVSLIR
jgi:hypothetical protein